MLVPVILLLVIQGVCPLLLLLIRGIRSNLKDVAVRRNVHISEKSVVILESSVYQQIMLAIVICTVVAIVAICILMRYVTKPVSRLMDSVRGGIEGIHRFEECGIREIDELYEVIKKLTDSQKLTEEQLLEEKERYRIAVESSQDLFLHTGGKNCCWRS